MSFKVFIYYCALGGGWAAFVTWAVVELIGRFNGDVATAALRGGVLGLFVAAAVGWVDAVLHAHGMQRLVRAGLCGVLGVLGGALGGVVGQKLFAIAPLLLFVGWLLAGVLIGAAVSAFDVIQAATQGTPLRTARKKLFNGVCGGFLGGLIGGLPYTFLIGSAKLPRSSLATSLVILGACIGFMIGLAQVYLKEAWLKIEEGARAGRELMLTKDETTIGRAETCDLGLFGDPGVQKLHARILKKNNGYHLAHAAAEGQTYLNEEEVGGKPMLLHSGDRIRMGKCLLRFGERARKI